MAEEKKREAVAVRDWIKADGAIVEAGDESQATGFRYIHLPSAKRIKPDYNLETDPPPAGSFFEIKSMDEPTRTMCAIFGALTLAGNVVNSIVNGPKGDATANPIPDVEARFADIASGKWADRTAGVGGPRYDKEKLAAAIATAKGETDPAPYLAKMDAKVDPKTGASVAADTKGAISYGAYALKVPKVKEAYDALTGGGADIGAL